MTTKKKTIKRPKKEPPLYRVHATQGQGDVVVAVRKTLKEARQYVSRHSGKASYAISYPDGTWHTWDKAKKMAVATAEPKGLHEIDADIDIPVTFAEYLCRLTGPNAELLWQWLDSTPHAIEEMIDVIARSHEDLATQMTAARSEYNPATNKIIITNLGAAAKDGESINHPQYYGGDTVYETIKVIHAWRLGFNLGNVVKYISRAGKKDTALDVEDLEKAVWYLADEIKMRRQDIS